MSRRCGSVLEAPPSPVATGNKKTTPPGSGSGGSAVGSGVEKCATATKKSGGLSGINLDVTYEVDCSDCDSLQTVQVFWGSRRTDGVKVGDFTPTINGKTYDAFVDGGKNSPFVTMAGNPPAHPTKPYYLTSDEASNQVKFSDGKGTVQHTDAPGAVVIHDEAYFETAIMCVNYKKSGKDKVLKAFKWGWIDKGATYQPSPGKAATGSDIEEHDNVSPEFKAVVAHDYPDYKFD